jgi:nitroreductase
MPGGNVVKEVGDVIEPAEVAERVVEAIDDERFFVLPHPEVAQYAQLKASDPEFDYYPTEWFEPYLSRRRATGFGLYDALGIARDDKAARSEQMLRNFKFFDAPVGLFITFSRRMSVGTFMDIGMFIENILIGARGEGLHTCGQVAWCSHHQMIREELGIDQDELLACGISVGYAVEDAPENVWHTDRADIDKWVTFFDE